MKYRSGHVHPIRLTIFRFSPDASADEMADTAALAERMANFVLDDDCTKN